MRIYIVTNPEDGWDCVKCAHTQRIHAEKFIVERVTDKKYAELNAHEVLDIIHGEHSYIIHERDLHE